MVINSQFLYLDSKVLVPWHFIINQDLALSTLLLKDVLFEVVCVHLQQIIE